MIRLFRFSPYRLALIYVLLCTLVLAIFVIPLGYVWRLNYSTFRTYVDGQTRETMVGIFEREGPTGLAAAIDARVGTSPRDEIIVLADPSKMRITGNLPIWPAEVADAPGVSGLVVDLGGSLLRLVVDHVRLPGGYHLLIGRESVRFQSLVDLFWYGIAGALGVVLVLGAMIGWIIRRALALEVQEVSRTAAAIAAGDLSGRVTVRGGSTELDLLAQTVNVMLEQLARQNVNLESEIAVRRQAEAALQRAHADLEQERMWFLESMDRINRAIQSTNDLEQMMSHVLEAALSIFGCDRAWLVYPCEPDARSCRVPMEHTRPEFPGVFALGVELPVDPEIAAAFTLLRTSTTPVRFGAGSDHAVPENAAQRFDIRSMIAMAIYPRGDRPYALGLHQCSYARAWTPPEERLFQEIGRRLEDALTSLLIFRDLRESQRRLEEAQRISRVGHWERNTKTGAFVWSDETYRIYGLSPQERIVTLAELPQLIHPEDRHIVADATARLQRGQGYDAEYRIIRPSGEVRFVHSKGDALLDESGQLRRIFGVTQDITERKLAAQRLLAQHAVTQILAAAATVQEATPRILQAVCESLVWDVGALWRVDRDAGVLRCVEIWRTAAVDVPEFEATTRQRTFSPGIGLPGRVWINREPVYVPDVVHDHQFPRAAIAARERLHAGFGVPIVLGREVLGVLEFFSSEIRQPDQDLLDMMAVIGSQLGQFIERKQAEEALAHARAELAHVARVATLGEMSASIAHEINQPLAAIVNNAAACLHWLDAQNLEQARESTELVIEDGHRAGEIIDRVRALVRKHPPRKDAVDINAIILEVIALVRYELRGHGVAVGTGLAKDLPPVRGDRIQLQQVLLNLIMNAIEAMSGDGEASRELSITSMSTEVDGIVIAVADSGPGLGPAARDRLFEAFHTTKPQGMGMGLAICRSIVEAHGGRLSAAPNEPRGAVFQFTLPIGRESG